MEASRMNPLLLPYAERRAPRYTSYPSAPHFEPSVDAAVYKTWLEALPGDASLSLYVHVPYCRRICWYCGCNTNAAHPGDTTDFVAALMREIDLVAAASTASRVRELHWGGGTPNILSPEEFTRAFHHIDFWFDLDQPLSHSIEIDPRHLTAELAECYARAGVTRASLGVQTFEPGVQQAIGRVQSLEQVRQAVGRLRGAGITQLSFDLMYGLPNQSVDGLLHSLDLAIQLDPDRISLFGYAHVPWVKRRQRVISAASLPDTEARYDQAQAARAALTAHGYVAVGLDHYAKPADPLARAAEEGSLHRNFQGYVATAADAIIGLGPSAISTLPSGYAQNATNIHGWSRALEDERLPIARGHAFSADDRRRAALIERLLCDFEVDLAEFGGAEAFARELGALEPLMRDGIVSLQAGRIVVPELARPFCRLVAQVFDAYAVGDAQYSRVI
jgi:oxygen-independent coproporphyrinogen-3 oxidase